MVALGFHHAGRVAASHATLSYNLFPSLTLQELLGEPADSRASGLSMPSRWRGVPARVTAPPWLAHSVGVAAMLTDLADAHGDVSLVVRCLLYLLLHADALCAFARQPPPVVVAVGGGSSVGGGIGGGGGGSSIGGGGGSISDDAGSVGSTNANASPRLTGMTGGGGVAGGGGGGVDASVTSRGPLFSPVASKRRSNSLADDSSTEEREAVDGSPTRPPGSSSATLGLCERLGLPSHVANAVVAGLHALSIFGVTGKPGVALPPGVTSPSSSSTSAAASAHSGVASGSSSGLVGGAAPAADDGAEARLRRGNTGALDLGKLRDMVTLGR
jgi:hypothetical protein